MTCSDKASTFSDEVKHYEHIPEAWGASQLPDGTFLPEKKNAMWTQSVLKYLAENII